MYVLDTSLLLGGKDPPKGRWATTPEAAAEIKSGGRDARRFADWMALGLQVRSAKPAAVDQVDEAGMSSGALGRLSEADRSLLALSLEMKATLVSDDYTVLDMAMRLGITTQTVNQDGPQGHMEWVPKCMGCGRVYETMPKADECIICGSAVQLKRK